DMGQFMLALLHGGAFNGNRVLSEKGLATMMAPQITTPAGSMGLVFIDRKLGGVRFVGHDGGTMSFFSVLLVSLERRLGVFVSYDGGIAGLALSDLFQGFERRYLAARPADSTLLIPRSGHAAAIS